MTVGAWGTGERPRGTAGVVALALACGACAAATEGSGVSCAWNTSGMTPGNYYIYGISTADAVNSAAQAYSYTLAS